MKAKHGQICSGYVPPTMLDLLPINCKWMVNGGSSISWQSINVSGMIFRLPVDGNGQSHRYLGILLKRLMQICSTVVVDTLRAALLTC